MTKTQKKRLIKYVAVLIIGVILIISQKLEKSKVSVSQPPQETEQMCRVHFLDVGQGDCTLIETSDGKYALIDASTQDASEKIVSYLHNLGIEELEFVLFTHPHEDHIGCGDEVLREFDVNTVYMNDKTENTSAFRKLLEAIRDSKEQNGTCVIKPEAGDTFNLSDIEFTVLSDGDEFDDLNNSSICLKMENGKSTFIFTGDAEKKVERYILECGESVAAEVLKCGHHGSSTSNSDAFLDAIDPDIAIISCGKDNDYGHPHDEVIKELTERDVYYKRTDLDGDIILAFNENSIGILPQ